MTARTILLWLDFEATGLDVRKGFGELLEYAWVLTDIKLNEFGCETGVFSHKMERIEALLQDKAREMHEKNGLLDELRSIPSQECHGEDSVQFVEDQLIARLKAFNAQEPTIFVLAGSSVWYDRIALKEHMPRLEKMLHYRQLDVSVYKIGFPEVFESATSSAHRAMSDIRESIKKHWLMRDIMRVRYPAGFES